MLPIIRHQIYQNPMEIIWIMQSKFNIRVSYMKELNARCKSIKSIFGSLEDLYRSLSLFMEAINSIIPSTIY